MKTRILSGLLVVGLLAVHAYGAETAVPAVDGSSSKANTSGLSAGAAEVVKLAGAGVGEDVVLAYVRSSQAPFNLTANTILQLKDAGVASPVIAAMLNRDGALRAQPVPRAVPGGAGAVPVQAPPPQQVAPVYTTVPAVQPAAPVEVVTVSPGPDYYWVPGYWGWNAGWIWTGGYWGCRTGWGWGGYHGWGGYRGSGWSGRGGWAGYHGGWGGFHGGGWAGGRPAGHFTGGHSGGHFGGFSGGHGGGHR